MPGARPRWFTRAVAPRRKASGSSRSASPRRWLPPPPRRPEDRRPPPPEWLLERGMGAGSPPALVHQGGCTMAKGVRIQPISEGQARRALYEHVEACPFCNPDTALHVIPE
ncbi:DUF6233 domain-containing protein [Streptomyces sp. NPDC087859]|uniref:DUF6233 domain-containing protein n=1 Tax=Streptomyces sp. NPDC087859 TaxID=3365812 RepID=UPI00382889A9